MIYSKREKKKFLFLRKKKCLENWFNKTDLHALTQQMNNQPQTMNMTMNRTVKVINRSNIQYVKMNGASFEHTKSNVNFIRTCSLLENFF